MTAAVDAAGKAPPEAPQPGSLWRHVKRGSLYLILGTAVRQDSGNPAREGEVLVVYRSESDGRLWTRPLAEFVDGRFVRVFDGL